MPFGDAIDLVSGLVIEWGTHTHASINDWSYPMTRADYATQLATVRFINLHRAKELQPFDLDWPFPDENAVEPEELARLTAELERRSAFNRGD